MPNKTNEFQTRFSRKKVPGTIYSNDNPRAMNRTQQHHLAETNINSIVKRYKKSRKGILGKAI